MTVISNGRRFATISFKVEKDFEDEIAANSKSLFGATSIYINAKRKIESKSLGGTIPDGFFFDFSDPEDPQFYIVEVELTQHSFYNHIFPQITKFFAFFNNQKMQKDLVDKLYSLIDTDATINSEFKKLLGKQEIYKFLSDIVDGSQNILLVGDGSIAELPEIMETYTDTWGRLVKFLEIHKHISGNDTVYTVSPDFETIQYLEPPEDDTDEQIEEGPAAYTEEFHLSRVTPSVREIYAKIKEIALSVSTAVQFNPQKYYISLKAPVNIAFLKIRKKKIRFIAMLPEETIRKIVTKSKVSTLSAAVQDFYNGPCAAVDIPDLSNLSEIEKLVSAVIGSTQSA